MSKIKMILFLCVLPWGTVSLAANFAIIVEMYQNGKLSERDYHFKRLSQAPNDTLSLAEQQQRILAIRKYRGKANGMVFVYSKQTLKPIRKVFAIDEDICDYAADKYFNQLKRLPSSEGGLNTLSNKDLKRMRFARCMAEEGWRRLGR